MTFRSFFDRSQRRRQLRRANRGHASRRPRFEALEDRRLLSFTPAVNYQVGAGPQAVVATDFNNDGRLDLVTSNPSDFNISVLLGDGQGGFGAAAHFDASPNAAANRADPWFADHPERDASLVIADFNEDGKLDVATVHRYRDPDTGYGDGYLSLFLGNGDGTFQTATSPDSGFGSAEAAAAGDFNGDGHVDLLVGADDWNDSLGQLRVLRGNGRGGFTRGPDWWLNYPPDAVVAADIYGDGKLDAIVLSGNISIVLGNGDGTFGHLDEIGIDPGGLDLALLEGFGLVVVGETLSIPSDHAPNGSMHTGVASGDFNGDGKPDVVTSDGDTGTVSLLLGNGDGTVRYIGAFAAGSSPSAVAVGDFNGDGRPDVAAANGGSNNVSVLLNDGAWPVTPVLLGDYNQNDSVDAADYVVWRKMQGTMVTPFSGADGNGDGMVNEHDYDVWRTRFGQISSPPAAGSGVSAAAEMEAQAAEATGVREQTNLGSPQVGETKSAVEVRGASEKQRALMERESAFVEFLAPPTTSVAEIRLAVRSPLSARVAHEASRRDDTLLQWLSQPDSNPAADDWKNENTSEDEETNNFGGPLFDSIVEVFAQLTRR
jgi:hypothetical protein